MTPSVQDNLCFLLFPGLKTTPRQPKIPPARFGTFHWWYHTTVAYFTMTTGIRQRPNAKKSKKKADKAKEDKDKPGDNKTPTSDANEEEPTLYQTFIGHWSLPFYVITLVVMIPYFLHNAFLYLTLQRPDLLAQYSQGLIRLRPPVAVTDERPVLIVGTISGGTSQVAHDLKKLVDLEVCHESSETTRHFCRDGTVSWFHGLRFLPRENSETSQHVESLAKICTNFTKNMGFHPRMYRDTSGCSLRNEWSKCWTRECVDLLHAEWGCAWTEKDVPCQTPYAVTLHQVRHPLRTIESLMAKFCPKGTMNAGYVNLIGALFPQHDFAEYSCLQAAGYYVLEYHRAMLAAVRGGLIQETYQVEEATPCEVASRAGFDGFGNDAVWQGSKESFIRSCGDPKDGSNAHKPMISTKYKVNVGQVALTQKDFTADAKLWQELVALSKELGYTGMDASS